MVDAHPHDIAIARADGLPDRDRSDFLTAYYCAVKTSEAGGDLDDLWSRMVHNRQTSAAALAGLVEGLAAARGARV